MEKILISALSPLWGTPEFHAIHQIEHISMTKSMPQNRFLLTKTCMKNLGKVGGKVKKIWKKSAKIKLEKNLPKIQKTIRKKLFGKSKK